MLSLIMFLILLVSELQKVTFFHLSCNFEVILFLPILVLKIICYFNIFQGIHRAEKKMPFLLSVDFQPTCSATDIKSCAIQPYRKTNFFKGYESVVARFL